MSEADCIFARMSPPKSHAASEDKELLHISARRRGTTLGQSRVVEVVHRRSDNPAEAPRPERASAHAAIWPDGFQARAVPTAPPADSPAATPALPPPVGHVVPGWEPLLPPIEPDKPTAKPMANLPRQPRTAKVPVERRFADPFAEEDTGVNCIRCGYLVEPARERHGFLTCAQCR